MIEQEVIASVPTNVEFVDILFQVFLMRKDKFKTRSTTSSASPWIWRGGVYIDRAS